MRSGGAFDRNLNVGIVAMLHGELYEGFTNERPSAFAKGEGKLAQHTRILVGKALSREGFAPSLAKTHGMLAHGGMIITQCRLERLILQHS